MDPTKLRVLVVEDEVVVAMSLRMLLDLHGRYEVVAVADDDRSALHAADALAPDLALVDIQLARGTSGFDVAAGLKTRGIPCIFMTGNAPAEPQPQLALGVLSKPFGDAALFKALEVAQHIVAGRRPSPDDVPSDFRLYVGA